MSRVSYSTITTGRRKPKNSGNSFAQVDIIPTMRYEMGDKKRWILPIMDNSIVGFSTPIHNSKNGFVVLPKKAGGTYVTSKIRCMHPSAQMSDADQVKIAKSGEMCLFCDLKKYEERQQWDIIGTEHPDFKDLDKKEQRAIFEDIQSNFTVESTFYNKVLDDGTSELHTFQEMYLLVLELEVDSSGNPIQENGVVKYEPILLPVSKKRLDKFKDAVETALDLDLIKVEDLDSYGEEGAEEKVIGWIDFSIKFPVKAQKMESGKDMSVNITPLKKSEVSDALKADFEAKAEDLVKRAEHTTNVFFRHLAPHTRAKAVEFLANRQDENGNVISGEKYFDALEAKYKNLEDTTENGNTRLSDDNRKEEIFARILEYAEKAEEKDVEKVEVGTTETAESTVETAETAEPKEEVKKVKRVVKKSETKEAPLDEDDSNIGDELLDF